MSGNSAVVAGPSADQVMWIERVLGVARHDSDRFAGPQPEEGPPPDFAAAPDQAAPESGLDKWTKARGNAIAALSALEAAFRESGDPLTDRGIMLLRAVRANLTERPETPQQLAELLKYIAEDSVVAEAEVPNGFGVKVELRKPLLTALAAVRADQKATAP